MANLGWTAGGCHDQKSMGSLGRKTLPKWNNFFEPRKTSPKSYVFGLRSQK